MTIGKKIIAVFFAAFVLSAALSGCLIQGDSSSATNPPYSKSQPTTSVQEALNDFLQEESEPPSTPFTEQYKDVYDEFSEALVSKTAVLISEIKTELTGANISELISEKESELSQLLNEGFSGFLRILNSSDEAQYSEYDYWCLRLQEVYDNEISNIEDSFDYLNEPNTNGEDFDY